jgi:hypothetical protein
MPKANLGISGTHSVSMWSSAGWSTGGRAFTTPTAVVPDSATPGSGRMAVMTAQPDVAPDLWPWFQTARLMRTQTEAALFWARHLGESTEAGRLGRALLYEVEIVKVLNDNISHIAAAQRKDRRNAGPRTHVDEGRASGRGD